MTVLSRLIGSSKQLQEIMLRRRSLSVAGTARAGAAFCRVRRSAKPITQCSQPLGGCRTGLGISIGSKAAKRSCAAQAASVTSAETATTRTELPKTFDPNTAEQRLYEWWESNGYFAPTADADAQPYVVPMPPPNVTGRLHMGHAMFATLEDIMVRFARMQGKAALWLPGTDHAGIATQHGESSSARDTSPGSMLPQMVVERMLAAEGSSRQQLGRAVFEERVWQWKGQYGGFITQQLRCLGASCDWSREAFTLDEQLSAAVREAFVRLHEKGLVYRGNYMVNWSPNLQTAVSDLEVEYSDEQGSLYFFKYPVSGSDSGEYIPVATTRPETILGDTAVAVHPEDDRYKHLVGRELDVPMTGRRIKVIADEYVDREFGTGALKITPGHDPNDYEIGQRFGLEIINIMNNDASLNSNAGKYQGLDRFEARKQLWSDMEAANLVLKVEPYATRVPRSQRGGEIVEPLVREQWFVRMEPLAKPALKAVDDGEIRIVPERFEKIYRMWLDNIKDWCISRQLWWGHRIPVWYVFPDQAAAEAAGGICTEYVVACSEEEAYTIAKARHGEEVYLSQDPDVLDTWFSSGLWPFSTLGWPNTQAPDFQRFYPTQVLETGHDILFFWVARMIMMGIEFTGKPPFSLVYLHGLVRDAQGRKMSKSLGNVVDPVDTIQQYGCDALRYTLATGTAPGADLNLSLDKVNSNRNFTNKLWNAGKFILGNLAQVPEAEWQQLSSSSFATPESLAALPLTERWIISALHQNAAAVTAALDKYDFAEAGRVVYDFFWGDFADWYIEAAKTRLYSADQEAQKLTRQVLVYSFDTILRLAHPFMPFITEELWQALPHTGDALIAAKWPAQDLPTDQHALDAFESLQASIRAVRNARAEYNVEPGRRIPSTFVVQSPELRQAYEQETAVLAALAKLDGDNLQVVASRESSGSSSGLIELVVAEGVEVLIPMAGLFDAAKELDRLAKQEAKLLKEYEGLEGRLKNKKFMDKAPPAVVEEVKAQAGELEAKLQAVRQKMSALQ